MAKKRKLLLAAVMLALVTPASSFTMPPPWVIMWGALAFAKTFASLKDMVFLVVDVMFGSEGAACTLCDKARILERVLFTLTLCSKYTRALTFEIFGSSRSSPCCSRAKRAAINSSTATVCASALTVASRHTLRKFSELI